MNFLRFSLVETERLDRIEQSLRLLHKKVNLLLPEGQVEQLENEVKKLSVKSDRLKKAIDQQKG